MLIGHGRQVRGLFFFLRLNLLLLLHAGCESRRRGGRGSICWSWNTLGGPRSSSGTMPVILSLVLNMRTHGMLFHFKLTDGSIVEDIEGLELSDLDAAREEAVGLARDLARENFARARGL